MQPWLPIAVFLLLAQPLTATPLTHLSNISPRPPSPEVSGRAFPNPNLLSLPLSKRKLIISASSSHTLTLSTYSSVLPLPLAATALHNFYLNLLSHAAGQWALLPELPIVSAEWGNIHMDLKASDGYLVPWSFVAEFAEKMVTATEMGFAGVFWGEYRHLATGAVIEVGVKVVIKTVIAPL